MRRGAFSRRKFQWWSEADFLCPLPARPATASGSDRRLRAPIDSFVPRPTHAPSDSGIDRLGFRRPRVPMASGFLCLVPRPTREFRLPRPPSVSGSYNLSSRPTLVPMPLQGIPRYRFPALSEKPCASGIRLGRQDFSGSRGVRRNLCPLRHPLPGPVPSGMTGRLSDGNVNRPVEANGITMAL
jgi:hypothetical protein